MIDSSSTISIDAATDFREHVACEVELGSEYSAPMIDTKNLENYTCPNGTIKMTFIKKHSGLFTLFVTVIADF